MCQDWRKYYCDVSVRCNDRLAQCVFPRTWSVSHAALFPRRPLSHVAVYRCYILTNVKSIIHFPVDTIWYILISAVFTCTGSPVSIRSCPTTMHFHPLILQRIFQLICDWNWSTIIISFTVIFLDQQCVVEWRVPQSKKKTSKAKQWEVYDAMLIRISGNLT